MGCSPSGTYSDCSSFSPLQDHSSLHKTCFCVGSSPWGPARSLLQCRLFTSHSSFQAYPTAPVWGSSQAAGEFLLPRGPAQITFVTRSFTTLYREIFALVPGGPPPPPSSLNLVPLELSHIFSHLPPSCAADLPFLKYVVIEVLPTSLVGSALANRGSTLKPIRTVSVGHRGSFWCLLTEAMPADPPLPKPCHVSPIYTYI